MNSTSHSSENIKKPGFFGSKLLIIFLCFFLALLFLLNIFAVLWISTQFKNTDNRISSGDVLIIYSGNSRTQVKNSDWLALSLKEAGFSVMRHAIDDIPEQKDFAGIENLYKSEFDSKNEAGRSMWLLTAGMPADWSAALAISWPSANLMLVDPVNITDRRWILWANQLAAAWPEDKKLFLVSSQSEVENLLNLYELMSGEDARLFPGFKKDMTASKAEIWQSLDANIGLSIIPTGSAGMPWLSSVYLDEITAVLTSQSVENENDSAPEIIAGNTIRANRKVQSVRLVFNLMIVLYLLLQFLLFQFWLSVIKIRLLKTIHKDAVVFKKSLKNTIGNQPAKSNFSVVSLFTVLFSIITLIILSLAILQTCGHAILPPFEWFMLIPLYLFYAFLMLPSAIHGSQLRHEFLKQFEPVQESKPVEIAIEKYEHSKLIRQLSSAITFVLVLTAAAIAIYSILFRHGRYDSWFWLPAAVLLFSTGGFVTRQISYAGGGKVLAVLSGGWLVTAATGMLSQYLA